MPTDLKPCPSCKCNMAQTESLCPPLRGWSFKRVACTNCKLKGPWCETFEMAIYRWNAMPRELTDEQMLAIAKRMIGLVYGTNEMGYEYPNDGELLACFEEPGE